ncbi:MAG: alpha/beta hydrolase [Alphaproteobacteria bacterium]
MPEIIFNGPDGRIEGRYKKSDNPDAPIVLILHPHPQHGGTMNNKVIYTMFHTFANQGFSTLRFNFRGVGKSQGAFSDGEGELADAACALDWLQSQNEGCHNIWIAGFSFGSWIAMQLLMRRPEITNFVAVAPPVNMFDFSFLTPCPTDGLILQGDNDSIVPVDDVDKLVDKLDSQRNINITYERFKGVDHFFKAKEDVIAKTINDYIADKNNPELPI